MPRLMSANPETLAERFWAKVAIRGTDQCWLWQGTRNASGYGMFRLTPGRTVGAHRAAWIVVNGEDPGPLHVLHRCDTPLCCNVQHLFLGTNDQNVADKMAKGRHPNSRMTHCRRAGHPFDLANTYITPKGNRMCRACNRDAQRRYQSRKKGQK